MTLTKVPSLHLRLTFSLFSVRLVDLGTSGRSSYATVVSVVGKRHILTGDVKVSHHHIYSCPAYVAVIEDAKGDCVTTVEGIKYSSPAHGGRWPSRTVGTSEIELS